MAFPLNIIVFVAASAGIAWISRSSLGNFRAHGFYRFFAWESILAILLLNLGVWFNDPWSIHQIVSWILLCLSLFLVIQGVLLLRGLGKPDSQRNDSSLLGIEKTTELVTAGVYGYIRHPLYSSLLFLAWGAFFKDPSWAGIILAGLATFTLRMTAKIEEAENVRFFGAAYQAYMQRTKKFIPFIF